MANNKNFSIKNGLSIGNVNVINSQGEWIGPNTNLIGGTGSTGATGATGPRGSTGATGPTGARSEEHTSELQSH